METKPINDQVHEAEEKQNAMLWPWGAACGNPFPGCGSCGPWCRP